MSWERPSYIPTEVEVEELRALTNALSSTYDNSEMALIYDKVITRVEELLWRGHRHEFFENQKVLYYFVVRHIFEMPEICLALGRFRSDLEAFFQQQPTFRWKWLGLKDILDLAINIPLSVADVSKLIVTETGKFLVTRAESVSHVHQAAEFSIRNDTYITDGRIMSSSKLVMLPFLRYVRIYKPHDPVINSLYAYLMPILDKLCLIFEQTHHKRSRNLYDKMLPIRTELEAIMHMPEPPVNLRSAIVRLWRLWRARRQRNLA